MCKCCGQENKGPEKRICLFVTCSKAMKICGNAEYTVTTESLTLEQAKGKYPDELFCEDWERCEDEEYKKALQGWRYHEYPEDGWRYRRYKEMLKSGEIETRCYFCKKVVDIEMDYCYGCGEHVCCDCDETDVYGRHTVEDHRWGEFQRRIMAMDRELIKRKFWAEGLLNTIEQANKDFPTFEPDILDTTNAIAFVSHLVDHIKEVEEWRKTWLRKRA